MKLAHISAILALAMPAVLAKNCDEDLQYCGSTLLDMGEFPSHKAPTLSLNFGQLCMTSMTQSCTLSTIVLLSKGSYIHFESRKSLANTWFIGKYEDQVMEALSDFGYPSPTHTQKMNALFYCIGGSNGDIVAMTICPKVCVDGGWGNNDYCLDPTRIFVSQGRHMRGKVQGC